MRRNRFTMMVLLLATTMLLGGCAGSMRGGSLADAGVLPESVQVQGDALAEHLQFSAGGVRLSGLGTKQAAVMIQCAARRPVLIDHRFVFTDKSSAILQPVMPWTMLRLEPGRAIELRADAPRDSARAAQLEVRWAR